MTDLTRTTGTSPPTTEDSQPAAERLRQDPKALQIMLLRVVLEWIALKDDPSRNHGHVAVRDLGQNFDYIRVCKSDDGTPSFEIIDLRGGAR